MHDDEPMPDVAAMCRQAGVPVDDRGARELVRIVARYCADICDRAEPAGDAGLVPRKYAREIGSELAVQIRSVFEAE